MASPRASFFDFNLLYLQYMGLWPQDWGRLTRTLYQVYQVKLMVMAAMFITATGIGLYMNRKDEIRFLADMDKAIVTYNYFFKINFFLIRRKDISILVDEILHSGDRVHSKREMLMKYHVVIITVGITSIIGGFQIIAQIKGELIVDAWMPFDCFRNHWTLLLASGLLAVFFGIPFMYRAISIQGIVCSIVLYICEQLVDLQQRLKALDYSVANDRYVRCELKEIIKKHIRLMGYARSLKFLFKEYFLIQNLAVTVELCLNALMVTIVGIEQKKHLVSFLAFLLMALMNAYIFCYLGQELMDQSARIAYAAYESAWTSWPVDMQKDLLILITAAQKNFSLSAGGIATMSMETFALALYNGYSIYAVLRDMVD